jgi:excisionase family DNA binding protein
MTTLTTQSTSEPAADRASPFFTINETCDYLRISRNTLYKLFDTGQLRRRKLGARVLVHKADLDHYIESAT